MGGSSTRTERLPRREGAILTRVPRYIQAAPGDPARYTVALLARV